MDYMNLLRDFGPVVGIVLFFIWRDWKREEGLVDRVKSLESFNNDVLVKLVERSTAVIATNTEQLRIINVLMDRCARVNDRPYKYEGAENNGAS